MNSQFKKRRIYVAALTKGKNVPSSRFRVRQYIDPLLQECVTVTEYCPAIPQMIQLPWIFGRIRRRYLFPWAIIQSFINIITRLPSFVGSRKSDITLISRSVVPGLEETVKLLPHPRVLDVDDAIWLSDPRGVGSAARLAKNVDVVIAGNEYISRWYSQYCNEVYVVPTAIDTEKYRPRTSHETKSRHCCTIGWIGTSGNFPNLKIAKPALEKVLIDRDDVRILIISNERPYGWQFDGERVEFRYWSESGEVSDLQELDVGIMPLRDSDWSQGKCSFKLLQYMAVGIPVVASPVGMNNDVLSAGDVGFSASNETEWYGSVLKLCDDPKFRVCLGKQGRKVVVEKYSTEVVARQLADVFERVALAHGRKAGWKCR
ncbi:glycosyltransferase [Guyparkeria halopsychrophila]|uniref:glycosyltransferase family 4 protein n=1 Tax=Guyparkeria halopsychrophila TaxID=3139421 RepID=UPI0037C5C1E9